MPIRHTAAFALSALMLSLLPLAAAAQAPAGPLAESWEVTVKPSHQQEFERALKDYLALSASRNDPRHWDVYVQDTGPDTGHFVLRSCCFSWADQDAYNAWNQDNVDLMDFWYEKVAVHVETLGHYYYEMDFANSHWPDGLTAPALVGVTEFTLDPGKVAQFHDARNELSQVAINQGWAASGKHWSWSDRIGGEPLADLVIPFSNYAAMTPGDQQFGAFLAEHMGEAKAAELMSRLSASVSASRYSIWVHRPDLSSPKD